MLKFTPAQVEYGDNNVIATYQKDEDKHYRTAEIKEYILVETGAISARQTVTFNLNELETVLRPESVYVASADENRTKIDFLVYDNLTTPVRLVFWFEIDDNQLPFVFPAIPLFPFNSVSIKPRYRIDNLFITFSPCGLLHHKKL
jgi:hypothetical protein